ncbi:hypothetical protein CP97_06245 [Aurantiacibacter atlanticus]|uniref:CMP/dCMP-type deaminase domain-containing protein n=1 Tax=Aurantiacibacter atlanticus TaxID=1648404 RepID=A0A0H4VBE5_9SPHN|nr:cytidine deaminase [Aurantiacibacter atlanticus]AKQ41705.1 hypothetical protein CP97_06245 [Aurantiacibacter atlanticus]
MSKADPLIKAALTARSRAYAPYSDFLVGCAIESGEGKIAVGANMENACYRLGVCAEQSALAAAQQAFGLANIRRLAIVGGPRDAATSVAGEAVTPCGGCRQAILEAADEAGADLEIICCDHNGNSTMHTTIKALLPNSFTLK